MIDLQSDARRSEFRSDLQTWIALRHFLPAALLRELASEVVLYVGNGEISLEDLFFETLTYDPSSLQSWSLSHRDLQHQDHRYIAYLVTDLVSPLQNHLLWPNQSSQKEFIQRAEDIIEGMRLGQASRGASRDDYRLKTPSAKLLADFIGMLGPDVDEEEAQEKEFVETAFLAIRELRPAIAALITKHLGDLLAGSDNWSAASTLYQLASECLTLIEEDTWGKFPQYLHDVVTQCLATATRYTKTIEASKEELRSLLAGADFISHDVALHNASWDLLAAEIATDPDSAKPGRLVRLVKPPLNQASYDLSSAEFAFARGEYRDALIRCRSVLQRQTALGLANKTNDTKVYFARILLGAMERESEKYDSNAFLLAARMFIEGADHLVLRSFQWPGAITSRYVTEEAVDFAIGVSSRHAGSETERRLALVEILPQWIASVPAERTSAVRKAIIWLAEATTGSQEIISAHMAARSVEALGEIAAKRPEIARLYQSHFVEAVKAILGSQSSWQQQAKALNLASQLVDSVSTDEVLRLIESTMQLLSSIPPDFEPLTRPAVRFLTSPAVADAGNKFPEVGMAIATAVFMQNVSDSVTGAVDSVSALGGFSADVLASLEGTPQLQNAIDRLSEHAGRTSSSAAAASIRALLTVPTLAGRENVERTFADLAEILDTGKGSRPSLSLTPAYSALLTIAGRLTEFSDLLGPERAKELWGSLTSQVCALWYQLADQPEILSGFAIPPLEKPAGAVIHNWTYASMLLAADLSLETEMLQAIRHAMKSDLLRDDIEVALASGASAEYSAPSAEQSTEAFYASLGRRLVGLFEMGPAEAREECKGLLLQCLARGPRAVDAAVIVKAIDLNLDAEHEAEAADYVRRLRGNHDLAFPMMPLLLKLFPQYQNS